MNSSSSDMNITRKFHIKLLINGMSKTSYELSHEIWDTIIVYEISY